MKDGEDGDTPHFSRYHDNLPHHDNHHGNNGYYGNNRSKVRNIQQCLSDRKYTTRREAGVLEFFKQPTLIKTLGTRSVIPLEGPQNTLQWSDDGCSLLSCGHHVTLLSYPDYQTQFCVDAGASIWGASFLAPDIIAVGSGVGFGAVLPLVPQHDVTALCDITTLRGSNVLYCHRGSIFSVKALPGLSKDLFYTSSADRTVRLHDARALCTCTATDNMCNNHVILRGTTSLTSLSVNPTNSYQFCVSHGNAIGIHDLRKCCSDLSNLVDRYDIPPSSTTSSSSSSSSCYNGTRNRISHTVYNRAGSEILVNTRTVGLLLVSTRCHEGTIPGSSRDAREELPGTTVHNEGSNTSRNDMPCSRDDVPNNHDNQRDQFVICEDSSGTGSTRLVGSRGPADHLGRVLTMWLNTKTNLEVELVSPCMGEEGRSKGIVARYTGHRNTRTVLKEAAFWGDQFILSGSDCGRLFVWDKHTGSVVAALPPTPPPAVVGGGRGPRVSVPLSVQPHPSQHPVVATCGLEGAVRVWEPTIRGDSNSENLESILSENRRILHEEEYLIPIPNSVVMRALSGVDPGDMLNEIL